MGTIHIGNSGVVHSGPSMDLSALRAEFDRQHYITFPGLIGRELLEFIQSQIDQGEFYERVHDRIGSNRELCMTAGTAGAALMFLVNDPALFEIIQDITQCAQIGCFQGRIYRVNPDSGHHDSWHDDLGEDRLIGMSINLSRDPYAGGTLQIRDKPSGQIVSEAPNAGFGDAIIFRLSHRFQHRITEMEGTVSKTAFAGWFRSQPDFLSLFKEQSQRAREVKEIKPNGSWYSDPETDRRLTDDINVRR